jgi:zinc and cadmium transporter
MSIYYYTISSIAIVSLISFVGVLVFSVSPEKLKKITLWLVSLSAGTLLGDSFLHLLPEAAAKNNDLTMWFMLIAGMLVFFVLEKFIHWRHCHISTSESHPHPVGMMNLVGDALHNMIDGVIIAGSFIVSAPLGFATTIAVVAHEIPQEIGDFGVLIHAGYSKRKAIYLNFMISLTALAGAIATLIIGTRIDNLIGFIAPFTAGGFIYIATADLIPELRKETGIRQSLTQLIFLVAGIAIMLGLKLYFS